MPDDPEKNKGHDYSKYYPLFFTIIFVVILCQYSFSSLEAVFYDLRVRYDIGTGYKDNIVLVGLDEESDEFLGETYPYTYAGHTRLIDKVIQDKPNTIVYLVNFLEPETDFEREQQAKFKDTIKKFKKQGGAFRFGTDVDAWGEQLPPQELKELGYSLALINVDNATFSKDDISRRAILNFSGEDTLHLWAANKFRESNGKKPLNINDIQGAYYMREADATFSLFRYYTTPLEKKGLIKRIPFHRSQVGNFPKGFFTDKIVIIGSNYISNASDYVLTPYNREKFDSPKLSLHAQIIQALIQNKTVYQVPSEVSYSICILISILLSVVISRVKPTIGLMITIGLILGAIVFSYILFITLGLWLYITHIILTIFVVYYIWVPFRAIGEYQRRYAIQEETKLIKKVENLKQNFISLMSHDLKTPVAKIAGLADVMKQKFSGNDDLNKDLSTIIESTKDLNKFITSILDLTKIESRNLDLKKAPKDINPIIQNIVNGLVFEAADKKIHFELDLSPLYPVQIDVSLIIRVISNLIENAIKYSGENSTITIKSWDDEKWIYVKIQDNGIGINENDIEHIFDKFYRVKNDASHSIKGTGLGLYLVKYFVELHGGRISAESSIGEGTVFNIMLKNE
ncbi:MAG: CHASE2 domain-containing protein [Bacteriovoracaceae bacterium]|jgi:signal transduction histidine kinase|nr:CHASE2 domain-containing protein [Bacteriovoracaceae bacterium]